jgi:hypothetical protein
MDENFIFKLKSILFIQDSSEEYLPNAHRTWITGGRESPDVL